MGTDIDMDIDTDMDMDLDIFYIPYRFALILGYPNIVNGLGNVDIMANPVSE
jgi:hypothetical protein